MESTQCVEIQVGSGRGSMWRGRSGWWKMFDVVASKQVVGDDRCGGVHVSGGRDLMW